MIKGCQEAHKISRRVQKRYWNEAEHPTTLWKSSLPRPLNFAWTLLWISRSEE